MTSRDPPARVLVVTLRRLGDVLFTTPLYAGIRRTWPAAQIDALVFDDTAGILAGNPDLDRVITMPSGRGFAQSFALALRLFKRYDLAISTQSGDRPTAFALLAGRRHLGPVDGGRRGALRRLVLSQSIPPQPGLHRLEETLRLADALNVARVPHLVCPRGTDPAAPSASLTRGEGAIRHGAEYAVIHAAPKFVYKGWTRDGWRALAQALIERGLKIVATGGPSADERAFLDDLWRGVALTRADGRLAWPQLAALLAGAQVFVGPDTSVTHLAAASGCPTVALFGPTDPRLWGPVPAAGLDRMWEPAGTIQRSGNVWLVQNPLPCVPCQNEGCDRHILSHSRCLDELASAQVLRAVDTALAATTPAPA
jgi:heptosyltransferase-3